MIGPTFRSVYAPNAPEGKQFALCIAFGRQLFPIEDGFFMTSVAAEKYANAMKSEAAISRRFYEVARVTRKVEGNAG